MKRRKPTTLGVLRSILGRVSASEEKLAQEFGLSVSWLKKASAGRIPLTPKAAAKISLATGVSPIWLLNGDVDAPAVAVDETTPFTPEFYAHYLDPLLHGNFTVGVSDDDVLRVQTSFAAFQILKVLRAMYAAQREGCWDNAAFHLNEFAKMMQARFPGHEEEAADSGFIQGVCRSVEKNVRLGLAAWPHLTVEQERRALGRKRSLKKPW